MKMKVGSVTHVLLCICKTVIAHVPRYVVRVNKIQFNRSMDSELDGLAVRWQHVSAHPVFSA